MKIGVSSSSRWFWCFLSAVIPVLTMPSLTQGAESEEWSFVVSPLFLWGKSLEGTSALAGDETELDLDFQDDVLENLDASFTLHGEARKGRITYFAEYNFATLDPTIAATLGPIAVNAQVEYDDLMVEAGVAWTLSDAGPNHWELLGGMRYFDQDVSVDISTERTVDELSSPVTVRGGDSWWNGFLGLRLTRLLSERWSLRLRGDFGYGGSNNDALHALGFVNYRFNTWGSAFMGYRFLSVDYDNERNDTSAFAYDVDQQGPLLGVNLHF